MGTMNHTRKNDYCTIFVKHSWWLIRILEDWNFLNCYIRSQMLLIFVQHWNLTKISTRQQTLQLALEELATPYKMSCCISNDCKWLFKWLICGTYYMDIIVTAIALMDLHYMSVVSEKSQNSILCILPAHMEDYREYIEVTRG